TTAINLAAALALAGQPTLVIDVDPQGNATSGLGLKGQSAGGGTIYQALMAPTSPDDFILATSLEDLHVVPATRDLAGAEIELIPLAERERRLRAFVEPLRSRFRFIVIDSPPSLGLLTLNALVAADTVLIPLHCEYFALEGLADLVATLRRVRAALNPALDIEGVLLTMNDERTNLGQQVARDVREFFKDKVYRTVIPRNVRLAEAPSHGMPVMTYDAKSRGAEAYGALARELLARNQKGASES
ncbi:MAG: ParA family protein, partial [Vicinamibacterales bacterium]